MTNKLQIILTKTTDNQKAFRIFAKYNHAVVTVKACVSVNLLTNQIFHCRIRYYKINNMFLSLISFQCNHMLVTSNQKIRYAYHDTIFFNNIMLGVYQLLWVMPT